ncbi:hypothetical protein [Paraburkholderia youngii]|uniref:hypothetical protein n=1 Tax=Paraburkholderia youngii TaxID=2782701 RepID=UPI003D1CD9FE
MPIDARAAAFIVVCNRFPRRYFGITLAGLVPPGDKLRHDDGATMQSNPNQLDLFGFQDPAIVASTPIGVSEVSDTVTVVEAASSAMTDSVPAAIPVMPAAAIATDTAGEPLLPGRAILPSTLDETPIQAITESSLDPKVMTLAEHDALLRGAANGDASLEPSAIRASFERLIRDLDAVKAELGKFKVADLVKKVQSFIRDKKKDYLVDKLASQMVSDYGVIACGGGAFTYHGFHFEDTVAAARRKLDVLTADTLAGFARSVAAERAERDERRQAFVKALTNPETLDEFTRFIEKRGLTALNAEQRARYDELVAEKMRGDAESRKAEKSTVAGVEVDVGMEIIETKHTRDQHDLWVVKLSAEVDKEKFRDLCTAAKRLGGYYSSFSRGGAVTGFQFKSRAAAENFVALGKGESVDNSKAVEAREETRNTASVARLRATAARTRDSAEAKLNQPRLTNTPKRARQASSAESDARRAIELAETMCNIADAIEAGDAKHLDKLTEKSQVEQIRSILIGAKYAELRKMKLSSTDFETRREEPATIATVEHVEFPHFIVWHAADIENFVDKLQGREGLVRLAAKLKPYAEQCRRAGEKEKFVVPSDLAAAFVEKLGAESNLLPPFWGDTDAKQKRLKRMGITTPEQLRAACREFVQFQGAKQKADRATELERQLVGSKVGLDFFPTPPSVCDMLVANVDPQNGEEGCDPQGGTGNIALAMRRAGFEPDVCEISSQLREVLEAKGFNIVAWDFLEHTAKRYDFICSNPPFSADIEHLQHAYSLLNEKGRVSSIVGESAFTRSDAKATAFRAWLDEVNAKVEKLPEGTFQDRSLLRTTGANARVVTIRR